MPVYKYQEFKTSDGTVFNNESDAHEYEFKYQLTEKLLRPLIKCHSNINEIEDIADTVFDLIKTDAAELYHILDDYLDEQTYNYK